MLLFTIKKTFFDMWDNMIPFFLINIGFILLTAGIIVPLTTFSSWGLVLGFGLAGICLLHLYSGAVAKYTLDVSDYKKPGFRDFFGYFKETWKQSLGFPLIVTLLVGIVIFGLVFYLSSSNVLFTVLGAFVFWVWLTILLAGLYYYPVIQRLKKDPLKAVKTSFILFFDNTAFTFSMALGFLIISALSCVFLFMLPGIATIMLWLNVCFKLRLYKYDYLEANPEANRKAIPWTELLIEDEKRVGKRTLRGMIFPWKE